MLRVRLGLVALSTAWLLAGLSDLYAAGKAPVVPAFERFHASGMGDPVKAGRLLLGELNCASCHQADAAHDVLPRKAPNLDHIAQRVKRSFLRKFLADPRGVKPGTLMPDVLASVPDADRQGQVEALVHFLASTGSLPQERPEKKYVAAGRDLYHKVGCVACHGTRDAQGKPDKTLPSSVPSVDLVAKYTLASLRVFLDNPHNARPAGRMPGLLKDQESREVANYLWQGASVDVFPPNLHYAYFEGSWSKLPDFSKMKPLAEGQSSGFDLSLARRPGDFALQFDGFLRIDRPGDYRFHVTSDDGSKLFIDDKLVVDNDGVHPPSTQSASVKLAKGMHRLRAGVFNAGGGVALDVDLEGPGLVRQSAVPYLFPTAEGKSPQSGAQNDEETFPLQQKLVDRGRELFSSLGCANCHQLGPQTVTKAKAEPLSKLKPNGGCLHESPQKGIPFFALNPSQRSALGAALRAPASKLQPAENVVRTLSAFNCYACHERDKIGGVEAELNASFATAQQEMGDEGRIPPSLTGAGAKLQTAYLKQILQNGSHDRPYMLTRMPRFGESNVGPLAEQLAKLDLIEEVAPVSFGQAAGKVKAEARHIVGAQALTCISCHTFAGNKAQGVQGIDMALMTKRVKRDWFHQYLLNPTKFRAGTRMPTAWPEGKSLLPKILGGDTKRQIEAIWVYLSDGNKAQLPLGVKKQFIPLVPDKEAIVYRNFLEGAGTRAIGVGYPEKAHLAFDANELRIALLWQGAFLDASRHWTDRGAGFEGPLGDNVLHLPGGVPLATLKTEKDPWPSKPAKELGYRFKGYRLAPDKRPTFLYSLADVSVEDFPNAVAGKTTSSIVRTLTLTSAAPTDNLYLRAAVADKVEPLSGGWYSINGEWKMRLESSAAPTIRARSGRMELLVPVRFEKDRARIVQEFVW